MNRFAAGAAPGQAPVDWALAAEALAEQAARVTALLRSVRTSGTPALGRWDVAEVAMHLSQAWIVVPGLASDDLSDVSRMVPGLEAAAGTSLMKDLWDLPGVTEAGVHGDPERGLEVLADRIEARAGAFLDGLNQQSASGPHGWLVDGVTVTLPTLICHLLSETIVHGYDIARADGRKWPIPRPHALLALEGFLFPVMAGLDKRAVVDQQVAAGVKVTYEVHLRGGGRYLFIFEDGSLRLEQPSSRRIDCHISADPSALLLLAWGRRGQWRAIARGELLTWGRKPWLGLRLRAMIRNP